MRQSSKASIDVSVKPCAVDGCDKPSHGRYCSMHYRRLYRNGSLTLAPKVLVPDRTLDAQLVRELFDYDPETGALTHKAGKPRWRPGPVGTPHESGYLRLGACGRLYYAQRLVWLHYYGEWPKNEVDHINGERADNRIVNLRDVDHATNSLNRHRSAAKTGVVGAQTTSGGRIQCYVKYKDKRMYLGKFDSAEQAHTARAAAVQILLTEHADSLQASQTAP